jgi:hypothetical protein
MRVAAYCWAALCVALPAFLVATSGHDPVKAAQVAQGTINSDMPPARFQGDVGVAVYFTDQSGIEKYCGKASPGHIIIACHRKHINGTSVLFMPNPCLTGGLEQYAKIMCHEIGHANGWSGDHEA